jgi:hypothetical protein
VLGAVDGAPVMPVLQPGGPAQPLAKVPFTPSVKPARPRIVPLSETDEAYTAP